MNKKITFLSVLIFAILVLIGVFWMNKDRSVGRHPPSQSSPEKRIKYYTCSMHPWVHSDKPGTCPVCGMALNPVYNDLEGNSSETTPAPSHPETSHSPTAPETQASQEAGRTTVRLSPEKQQLIGVKTALVERRTLTREIHATGRVAYHPDLFVAQNEYLIALKTARTPDSDLSNLQNTLIQAAKTRLRLLGMSDFQIQELSRKKKPQMSLILPQTGDSVWIYGSLYESDLAWVKPGTSVQVRLPGSSEPHSTSIESIDPTIDPITRTAQARLRISNSLEALKPDMYVKLAIEGQSTGEVLAIPSNAILSTGTRKIAFVDRGGGKFEPRNLKIGRHGYDYVEVLSGISEGERVVTSANFLIDSESQLKAAISGMGGHP